MQHPAPPARFSAGCKLYGPNARADEEGKSKDRCDMHENAFSATGEQLFMKAHYLERSDVYEQSSNFFGGISCTVHFVENSIKREVGDKEKQHCDAEQDLKGARKVGEVQLHRGGHR